MSATSLEDTLDCMHTDLSIRLPNATQLSGEGYKFGLRGHPLFCWVCTNLDRAVAGELYGVIEPGRLYLDDHAEAVLVCTNLQDIAEAAEGGCSSCLLLHECVVAFKDRDIFDCADEVEVSVTYFVGTTMILTVKDAEREDRIELFTLQGEPCPWPTIGPLIHTVDPYNAIPPWPGGLARAVPYDSNSDDCYETIRNWITFCEQEHPWCDVRFQPPGIQRNLPSQLPKRLLHIGTSDDELHLCETEHLKPAYVALSYCWGAKRSLIATQSNLEQLKISVPFEQLARTCQDAVSTTRRLGFRYLWIDSLCIVQDDRQDWAKESANMASIYANAYLCIAATGAASSDAGIFSSRQQTKTISVTGVDGNVSQIFARNELRHAAFDWRVGDMLRSQHDFSEQAREQHPLFTRGWAFQERLLSPRVLHYTQSELVWECLGSTSCECGTMDQYAGSSMLQERRYVACIPPDIEIRCDKLSRARELNNRFKSHATIAAQSTPMLRDTTLCFLAFGHPNLPEDQQEQASDRWHSLVTEYSKRALTYATDALPAVSGLASRWALLNDPANTYLAGLWQHSLQRDLLWKVKDTRPVERPQEYLAPTWTWASIRRAVQFMESNYDPVNHISILDVVCNTFAMHPYGPINHGYIKLQGPSLRGKIVRTHNLEQSSYGIMCIGQNRQGFYADSIPECTRLEGKTAFVLWCSTDTQDKQTRRGFERGIVLVENEDRGSGVYSRIGLMEGYEQDASSAPWQDMTLTII